MSIKDKKNSKQKEENQKLKDEIERLKRENMATRPDTTNPGLLHQFNALEGSGSSSSNSAKALETLHLK